MVVRGLEPDKEHEGRCWLFSSGSAADCESRRGGDISCTASGATARGTVVESSLSSQGLFSSKT